MQIPYTVERRADTGLTNGQLGMWLFIASEVMLFGGLFSSYVILRMGAADWPAGALNTGAAAINTAALFASSFTLARSISSLRRGETDRHRLFLLVTIGLALLFLAIKSFEYREHLQRHELPATSTFFALYYTLTGLHALHIAGGLAAMLYLCWSIGRSDRRDVRHGVLRLEYTALYWYFVDLIWICLLVTLYLW